MARLLLSWFGELSFKANPTTKPKEQMMKRTLMHTAISAVLALGVFAPGVMAKKKKYSAAHNAAIKQCNADYTAAIKEANTKKGKEKEAAIAAARKTRKECKAQAPQ